MRLLSFYSDYPTPGQPQRLNTCSECWGNCSVFSCKSQEGDPLCPIRVSPPGTQWCTLTPGPPSGVQAPSVKGPHYPVGFEIKTSKYKKWHGLGCSPRELEDGKFGRGSSERKVTDDWGVCFLLFLMKNNYFKFYFFNFLKFLKPLFLHLWHRKSNST